MLHFFFFKEGKKEKHSPKLTVAPFFLSISCRDDNSVTHSLCSTHLGRVEWELAKYPLVDGLVPGGRESLGARSSYSGWMVGRENCCELGSMIHRETGENWLGQGTEDAQAVIRWGKDDVWSAGMTDVGVVEEKWKCRRQKGVRAGGIWSDSQETEEDDWIFVIKTYPVWSKGRLKTWKLGWSSLCKTSSAYK